MRVSESETKHCCSTSELPVRYSHLNCLSHSQSSQRGINSKPLSQTLISNQNRGSILIDQVEDLRYVWCGNVGSVISLTVHGRTCSGPAVIEEQVMLNGKTGLWASIYVTLAVSDCSRNRLSWCCAFPSAHARSNHLMRRSTCGCLGAFRRRNQAHQTHQLRSAQSFPLSK